MGVIAGQAEKDGQRFMGAVEEAWGWSPGMSVMSQTETRIFLWREIEILGSKQERLTRG